MATIAEIQDLNQFLTTLPDGEREQASIDVLYDRWRKQAFEDMKFRELEASILRSKNGEKGQPLDEFLAEVKAERQRRQRSA